MSDLDDRVRQLLLDVVPDAADQPIDGSYDLREQLDMDSMDHLNFLTAVAEAFGVDIPERDYPQLVTLDAVVSYVASATRP